MYVSLMEVWFKVQVMGVYHKSYSVCMLFVLYDVYIAIVYMMW